MEKMRVLIACESSGVVREAFRALGHSAWSCDLLPADDESPYHLQEECDGFAVDINQQPRTEASMSNGTWLPGTEAAPAIQDDDSFEAKDVTLTEAEAIQLTAFATTLREMIR
jgi:hypothetical protein